MHEKQMYLLLQLPPPRLPKSRETVKKRKRTSKAKKKENEQIVNASFAAAFPPPKSPHHNCSYDDCHIDSNMFFLTPSEKCNKCKSLQLHHVCMIEYGSKTYGEAGEGVGMGKFCKSCFAKAATDKGINKISKMLDNLTSL